MTSLGSAVEDEESVTSLMKPETASMMLRSLGGCEGTVSGPPDRACRGDSADILVSCRLLQIVYYSCSKKNVRIIIRIVEAKVTYSGICSL